MSNSNANVNSNGIQSVYRLGDAMQGQFPGITTIHSHSPGVTTFHGLKGGATTFHNPGVTSIHGLTRASDGNGNGRAIVATNDGTVAEFDPKVVETLRLVQVLQNQQRANEPPPPCRPHNGNQLPDDKINRLELWRYFNPVYWTLKMMDYGRRQHCMRLGPNAYGSFCVKNSGPAQYDPEKVFFSPRPIIGDYFGGVGPFRHYPPSEPYPDYLARVVKPIGKNPHSHYAPANFLGLPTIQWPMQPSGPMVHYNVD